MIMEVAGAPAHVVAHGVPKGSGADILCASGLLVERNSRGIDAARNLVSANDAH